MVGGYQFLGGGTADPAALIGSAGGPGVGVLNPPRLQFPHRQETVISAFQAGHGWTASGTTGATMTDDTTDFMFGAQSIRITTAGAGATHEWRSPTLALDLSNSQFVLAVKLDDFTNFSDLQVRVSSNGFTDFAYFRPVSTGLTQRWVEPGKWTLVTFTRSKLVAAQSWNNGGMQISGVEANINWSAITGVRIRLIDNALGTCTARFNLVAAFPLPAKPLLSIIFDDGRSAHWAQAKRYMDRYRMPGTAAIIGNSIGSGSAYMTLDQAKELPRSQWDTCVHAMDNADGSRAHADGYDGLTYASGESDLLRIKAWLETNGFLGAHGICYPHGSWSINQPGTPNANPDVLAMVAKHCDWGRTTYSNTMETYPPAHRMKLRSFTVTNADTAATMLSVLDAGIAGRNWVLMQFHDIVDPAVNTTATTPTIFQAFIDGVQTRVASGSLLVRTPQQVLQYGAV